MRYAGGVDRHIVGTCGARRTVMTAMDRRLGRGAICGGPVVVEFEHGDSEPHATCEWCGTRAKYRFGPLLEPESETPP